MATHDHPNIAGKIPSNASEAIDHSVEITGSGDYREARRLISEIRERLKRFQLPKGASDL